MLISNIIKTVKYSEIRENGVYLCGYFYKWAKIKSYNWVSSDTIEFKVNTFLWRDLSLKFTINEKLKLKVDEVIQKNLTKLK